MKFKISDRVQYKAKDRRNGIVLGFKENKVIVKWNNNLTCSYGESMIDYDFEFDPADLAVVVDKIEKEEVIDWNIYHGVRKKDIPPTSIIKDEDINWKKYHGFVR